MALTFRDSLPDTDPFQQFPEFPLQQKSSLSCRQMCSAAESFNTGLTGKCGCIRTTGHTGTQTLTVSFLIIFIMLKRSETEN